MKEKFEALRKIISEIEVEVDALRRENEILKHNVDSMIKFVEEIMKK